MELCNPKLCCCVHFIEKRLWQRLQTSHTCSSFFLKKPEIRSSCWFFWNITWMSITHSDLWVNLRGHPLWEECQVSRMSSFSLQKFETWMIHFKLLWIVLWALMGRSNRFSEITAYFLPPQHCVNAHQDSDQGSLISSTCLLPALPAPFKQQGCT